MKILKSRKKEMYISRIDADEDFNDELINNQENKINLDHNNEENFPNEEKNMEEYSMKLEEKEINFSDNKLEKVKYDENFPDENKQFKIEEFNKNFEIIKGIIPIKEKNLEKERILYEENKIKLEENIIKEKNNINRNEENLIEEYKNLNKIEENKIEEKKIEENEIEENKIEENKIEENKIEENKIEENKIEEKKIEENKNKIEENKIEENKIEEKKTDQNKKKVNKIELNKIKECIIGENTIDESRIGENRLEDNIGLKEVGNGNFLVKNSIAEVVSDKNINNSNIIESKKLSFDDIGRLSNLNLLDQKILSIYNPEENCIRYKINERYEIKIVSGEKYKSDRTSLFRFIPHSIMQNHIFPFFSAFELFKLSGTSREWRELIRAMW